MKTPLFLAALGIQLLLPLTAWAQATPQPSTYTAPTVTLGHAPARNSQTTQQGAVQTQVARAQVVTPLVTPLSLDLNTSIRRASRNFFNAVYSAADGVPSAWTGNVSAGNAGDTSQPFKDAVTLRINAFRGFAGIPANVTLLPSWSAEDQLAALMMSANDQLNHFPPTTWIDYTAAGADAAGHSNLDLGTFGPEAITNYIQDPGANNYDTGHRRWILYPPNPQMGTGDIPADGSFNPANALWVVVDDNPPDTGLREAQGFIAWPPRGYVPYQLIFPRWSFSLRNANFTNATVTVTHNGAAIGTVLEAVANGYGDNTLVWTLSGTPDGSPPFPAPASDSTYNVTVSNVISGGTAHSYSYSVIAFDPSVLGPDDIIPALTAPASVSVGSTTNIPFTTLPEASGYEVWTANLQTATWVEGAETTPLHLTGETTGTYPFINSTTSASGSKCFQLLQDEFNDQDLLLNSEFVASATSAISFRARYGYMTSTQFAEVQVSLDDGVSWATVFSRAGTSTDTGSFGQPQSVSLAAFANRIIRIRFVLAYTGGSAFNQTSGNQFGWLIDNITPVNLQEASSVVETPIASSPYAYVAPGAPTTVPLAVRAVLYNNYPLEYGPVSSVSVMQNSHAPVINSPLTASGTVGTSFNYATTATSTGSPTSFAGTGLPPGLTIDPGGSGVISGTPTQAGTFPVSLTATNTVTSDVGTATLVITIAKASANVVLGSLSPTYTSTPQAATAGTTPTGLSVNFTYNGSSTPPTAAGSYTVVGTVNDPNYQGSSTGTFVIAKATLAVGLTGTVGKVYDGTTSATLTLANYSFTPLGGDNVTLSGFATGAFADKNVGAGKQVTVNGLSLGGTAAGNYQLASSTVSAAIGTITAAPLNIQAGSVSKTYDGKPFTGVNSVTYTGLVPGEAPAILGGTLVYTGSWQGAINAGSYPSVPSGLTSTNYNIHFIAGGLTILPAPVTVTVAAGTSVYGQDLSGRIPGLTITGLVNGETAPTLGFTSVITGTGTGITSSTNASTAKYSLTIGGGWSGGPTNGNYMLKPGTASPVGKTTTWTVTQATLTVKGLTGTSIFGQTPVTNGQIFTLVSNNGVTDQAALLNLLAANPTTSAYTFNITSATDAGTYTTDKIISALLNAGVNPANYKLIIGTPGAWTVAPDTITIAGLTNGSSTYGFATGFNANAYFTLADQNNTPNLANLLNSPHATLTATALSNVGTYSVTVAGTLKIVGGKVNGAKSTDYKVVLVPGSWKINPQPVAITVAGGSSIYGAKPLVPALTATGSVNGRNTPLTATLLKGYSTDLLAVIGATGNNGARPYTFDLTGTGTGNYIASNPGATATWNVNPAAITAIRVNPASTATVGSNPIDVALTVTGLVNGDKPDALGFTLIGTSGNLTSATPAGIYPFTVGGSLANPNYVLKAGVGNPPATPAGAKVTIK